MGAMSSSANYSIFDFLHPFYSLCNIEYTYGRFDEVLNEKGETKYSFYDIAKHTKGSLLLKLLALDKKNRDEWGQKHCLISDAVIRVTDVQWAIYDELLRTRAIHKSGDDSLIAAYEDITRLSIKLYPLARRDNGQKAHVLKFEFLNVLAQHIREIGWDKLNPILYISTTDLLQKEYAIFINNLLTEIARMPDSPIPAIEVRRMIRRVSGLDTTKLRSLTPKLRTIFEDGKKYTKQAVRERTNEILVAYASVKGR